MSEHRSGALLDSSYETMTTTSVVCAYSRITFSYIDACERYCPPRC
ncbi:unnamed protein product [Leptidea sinapis]|uniref:Uncharacterized protein n=1 Tax=Leptidea sinapis TaxID=189913 RepID=A0A5E4PRS0_9NEOP|nr:unnamed protein product [Leptidea sinapis]